MGGLFEFLILWIISYTIIMIAMCFDNYMWIPADYKWYGTNEWRKHFKVLFILPGKVPREYVFPQTKEGWKIVMSRIKDVLTHQYDIVPAAIISFIISLILTITP